LDPVYAWDQPDLDIHVPDCADHHYCQGDFLPAALVHKINDAFCGIG
jgi:hypothetical protein